MFTQDKGAISEAFNFHNSPRLASIPFLQPIVTDKTLASEPNPNVISSCHCLPVSDGNGETLVSSFGRIDRKVDQKRRSHHGYFSRCTTTGLGSYPPKRGTGGVWLSSERSGSHAAVPRGLPDAWAKAILPSAIRCLGCGNGGFFGILRKSSSVNFRVDIL